MARFELVQRCWPSDSLRTAEVAHFLAIISQLCRISSLAVADNAAFEPTPEAVRLLFDKARKEAPFPGAGVDVDVFGRIADSEDYVRFQIHSGTRSGEPFIDFFNVDLGEGGRYLSADEFSQVVSIVRPFEGFLAELENEEALDAYTRQGRISNFETPAIIRALHYLDGRMISSLGGVDHCLRAPASKVEPFLDGVIFELTPEPFNPGNPQHLEAQRRIMKYLGLLTSR